MAAGAPGAVPTVAVVGGGVIGCCVALYTARAGRKVLLLEGEAVACAASGKAGGYLAKHQTTSAPIQELMQQSFELHRHHPLATSVFTPPSKTMPDRRFPNLKYNLQGPVSGAAPNQKIKEEENL